MILDDCVEVGVTGRLAPYYRNLGYEVPTHKDCRGDDVIKNGTRIKVSVNDLKPTSNIKIRVKCDICGYIMHKIYYSYTRRKNTDKDLCLPCAQKRNFQLEGNTSSINGYYYTYKRSAEGRNYSFELTMEDFKEITAKDCYYCGVRPSKIHKEHKNGVPYVCNGIDRLDNTTGYTVENAVPCCTTCNIAKGVQTLEEFTEWVHRCSNHLNNN